MTTPSYAHQAAKLIQEQIGSIKPVIGITLGSGLGALAEQIKNPYTFNYADLPGFPVGQVAGHAERLLIGELEGCYVACYQGRAHIYEGFNGEQVNTMIRTLKLLGCESLILTNAAGSLRSEVSPGHLVIIKDHINGLGMNPCVGPNDEVFGPRFFPMHDAYDLTFRENLRKTALEMTIPITDGVYYAALGPSFETPAEIRAFKILGADLVGMSTVPEVISARHCGLRVAAISAVTNYAAGMSSEAITHEGTLKHGADAAVELTRLITNFIKKRRHFS